jgi:hypothetical protein
MELERRVKKSFAQCKSFRHDNQEKYALGGGPAPPSSSSAGINKIQFMIQPLKKWAIGSGWP